jgi:hypothetical protein
MNARAVALQGALTLAAMALRLTPIERELLLAGWNTLFCRSRPPQKLETDSHVKP